MQIEIKKYFRLNMVLPPKYKNIDEILLFKNDIVEIRIRNTPFSLDHRKKMKEIIPPEDCEAVSILNRTYITPELLITFLDDSNVYSSYLDKNKKIKIKIEEQQDTPWYKLFLTIKNILTTITRSLFFLFQNKGLLTQFQDSMISVIDNLPYWFVSLKRDVISMRDSETDFLPLSFSFEKNKDQDFQEETSFPRVEFDNQKFENLKKILISVNPINPKWDVIIEYLFLAEENWNNSEMRFTIIDLDIAIDLITREYLIRYTKLSKKQFQSLSEDMSTGDLIKSALLFAKDQEFGCFRNFQRLHNLRNTILHRYQRKFHKDDSTNIINAKESLNYMVNHYILQSLA